jgi:hypothetical protein
LEAQSRWQNPGLDPSQLLAQTAPSSKVGLNVRSGLTSSIVVILTIENNQDSGRIRQYGPSAQIRSASAPALAME